MSLLASCVFSPLIYANTFSEIMLPRQTLFPLCHTCFAITFSSNLFMKWKCVKLSHEKSEQWKKRGVVAVGEQLMKTDPQHSLAIFWFLGKNKTNSPPPLTRLPAASNKKKYPPMSLLLIFLATCLNLI